MNLKTRRILYTAFTVLFFLAAPPLVLYTAGFRYDFKYNRVVETGSMVVKSLPSEASIYIDSVQSSEPTPTIINTILPGEINLLVSLSGHHSWEKKIDIKPRVTSFEERIKLFSISEPIQILNQSINEYWWNKNFDKLAYVTEDGELRLLNILNQKDTLVANVTEKPLTIFSWSPHTDEILIGRSVDDTTEYVIVDANAFDRITPLSINSTDIVRDIAWDPRSKSTLLGITKTESLVRFNYLINTTRTISEGPILKYLATNNKILMIQETLKNNLVLAWLNPSDDTTIHIIPEIIPTKFGYFLETHNQQIAIANTQTNSMTIIDPALKAPLRNESIINIPRAQDYHWSKYGNELIYSDGFGIYNNLFTTPISIVPNQKQTNLVTRYSKPITSLAVTDDNQHVFYTVDNNLLVREVHRTVDPKSTTLLENVSDIKQLNFVGTYDILTYLDGDNMLTVLPLSLEETRSFPFSSQ